MHSFESRERRTPEPLIDRRDPDHYLEEKLDPTESIGEEASREGMEQLLGSVNPTDALVIRLRCGMLNHPSVAALGISPDDKQSFTLERVAELLGISSARARQRQERALQIMTSTPERKRLVSVFGTKLPQEPDMKEILELVNKYQKKTDGRN